MEELHWVLQILEVLGLLVLGSRAVPLVSQHLDSVPLMEMRQAPSHPTVSGYQAAPDSVFREGQLLR